MNQPLPGLDEAITTARREKKYTISEPVFGVTMQGEGVMVGKQTVFLRLHLCDGDGHAHWCEWCDTPYSWDKNDPGFKLAIRKTLDEIVQDIGLLHDRHELQGARYGLKPLEKWVTISGGNPLIQLDDRMVDKLLDKGYSLQIETQGTLWKSCLHRCHRVVVSPKPPSSGLDELPEADWDLWSRMNNVSFKVVIFDDVDFEWAAKWHLWLRQRGRINVFCIQAGTPVEGDPMDVIQKSYAWLVEKWLASGRMTDAVCLPQLHAIVWGRKKGV